MAKTILVTGAGRGLGRALSEMLAARGENVIAHARSEESLRAVPHARALIADLERPESLAAAVAAADLGPVDAVVHNAGIAHVGEAVADHDLSLWRSTMAVNLLSAAELTRLLLPRLRRSRGQVVFVNSGAGLSAGAGWSSYAASKHALKALADALRAEERGNGLRVTSLFPSHFDTDMQRSVRKRFGSDYDPGRAVSVESIARVVVGVLESPGDVAVGDMRVEPPDPLPIRRSGL